MHIETFERRKHTISLTPLIDVVFILLVFFMLATSFTDWRPITLATGTTEAPASETPPAVVRVDAEGGLNYDGRRYDSPRELARRLNSARDNDEISAVIVQPDAQATLDVTVGALDALSGAGVAPMSLATGSNSSRP
ncbi:biopolymer transporter ExbD [Endozoicomonas sp. G2_2]|uniref:ExbD/TolR family protein n=1 Tax=Endozoicomonas sp. G2_2 TaxID=2821092 RepID=UPI001ADCEE5D|nr:biopolymer transporter ExbD [Endozoicomonas sp. G2_2]MBO9469297.1 biopolymer transporter ExbD [Endozoicomonas sp. G2_2]